MSFSIALLVVAVSASGGPVDEHAKYLQVHKEWLRLHKAPDAQAQLVVDPDERAMWIEVHGEVFGKFAVDLPQGYRWYAFHVTQNGIVERSFPVRLTNPRSDIRNESQEESLCVIGVANSTSCQFSFAASRSATVFHVGSGSMISDVTFHLPTLPHPGETIKYKSFLASQSTRQIKPADKIRKDEFSVRVVRRPTLSNVK